MIIWQRLINIIFQATKTHPSQLPTFSLDQKQCFWVKTCLRKRRDGADASHTPHNVLLKISEVIGGTLFVD